MFAMDTRRSPFFAIAGLVGLGVCIFAALCAYASYQMNNNGKSILKSQVGPILSVGNGSMPSTMASLNDPAVNNEDKMHLLTKLENSLSKNKRKAKKPTPKVVVDTYDSSDDEDVLLIDASKS